MIVDIDLPARGRLDDRGWIVEADAALAALQGRAGGSIPGVLCVPQIAALARLARRIGAPLRRTLFVAHGQTDIALDVEARLEDGQGMELIVTGWRGMPAYVPASVPVTPAAGGSAFPTIPRTLEYALREPLEAILTEAGELATGAGGMLDRSLSGYAQDILAAGRHLSAVIDDAMDIKMEGHPYFRAETSVTDLAIVAREAAAMAAHQATETGVKLLPPPPGAACPVRGDHRKALEIAVNLVCNGIRYAPIGSEVLIGVTKENGYCALIVIDRGKGIDPADHERIFEQYHRIEPDTPGGSGLGLYIARRLARAMGGDIRVESSPGAGAAFIFTLPSARA